MSREEYWRQIVKSYEESGLNAEEFCQNHGIAVPRLKYYCKKFINKTHRTPSKDQEVFEPLIIAPISPQEKLKLSIHLPNKIRCDIEVSDRHHQLAVLKELVALC